MKQQPSPPKNPKEQLDDNARKFVITRLDADFLESCEASSYDLVTDWLETVEESEKKVVCKRYDNGDVQRLRITKVTKDGNRTSEKEAITEEEYEALRASASVHVEKRRHEFAYRQDGVSFVMKYDEFLDSDLCVLEVDAETEELREAFVPEPGLFGVVQEVTGDVRYYGYRVAGMI